MGNNNSRYYAFEFSFSLHSCRGDNFLFDFTPSIPRKMYNNNSIKRRTKACASRTMAHPHYMYMKQPYLMSLYYAWIYMILHFLSKILYYQLMMVDYVIKHPIWPLSISNVGPANIGIRGDERHKSMIYSTFSLP